MKCPKCQSEIPPGQTNCNYCGETNTAPAQAQTKKKSNPWLTVIFIIAMIGFGLYNVVKEQGIQKNQNGVAILDSGSDYEQAIIQFEEALKNVQTKEEKITILKNIAYTNWIQGLPDKSLQRFKEALALADNESADFYLISGEIALLENNPKQAEELYLKAQNLEPDDFQINTSLAVFYLGIDAPTKPFLDFNKALEYGQKALDANPDSETAKENVASAYFYLAKYDEAIDLYLTTSLENKPFNNYMLGLSYYGNKDYDNAREYLQTAIDMGYDAEPKVTKFLNNPNDPVSTP